MGGEDLKPALRELLTGVREVVIMVLYVAWWLGWFVVGVKVLGFVWGMFK